MELSKLINKRRLKLKSTVSSTNHYLHYAEHSVEFFASISIIREFIRNSLLRQIAWKAQQS